MDTIPPFEVFGTNATALFTLKIFRGEGMVLLGMNWKNGQPGNDFVGFGIEYQEPGGAFFAIHNRLAFPDPNGNINPVELSTLKSPIQKWRWIHFPMHPNLPGDYTYRVSPVFMDSARNLTYGDPQVASVQLEVETYPGNLNIAFTRGFVSSQAFVEKFAPDGDLSKILPSNEKAGLDFVSGNQDALVWMGFEARKAVIDLLDKALADASAEVRVTAYDFNEPEVLNRLVQLGNRVKVIIDNSKSHIEDGSAENEAEIKLIASAGAENVQRQKMGAIMHSKTIAVSGNVNMAIGGSTNFSWRGFFVQNNNAVVVQGEVPVKIFFDAFENLWNHPNKAAQFAATPSSNWNDLGFDHIQAKVAFSPHNDHNAILQSIADDISQTSSSLMYSLAFLYESPGPVKDSIVEITGKDNCFVYGISDRTVGGLDIQKPNGNLPIAFPANLLSDKLPEPFKSEPSGKDGNQFGVRMHHKFVVIDFDKPNARVYMGSYNFSKAADIHNAENLFLFQDRRVAVSYMIQAVSMFDHYEFRDLQSKSPNPQTQIFLHLPPQNDQEKAWWVRDFTDVHKIKDRIMFSQPMDGD